MQIIDLCAGPAMISLVSLLECRLYVFVLALFLFVKTMFVSRLFVFVLALFMFVKTMFVSRLYVCAVSLCAYVLQPCFPCKSNKTAFTNMMRLPRQGSC